MSQFGIDSSNHFSLRASRHTRRQTDRVKDATYSSHALATASVGNNNSLHSENKLKEIISDNVSRKC